MCSSIWGRDRWSCRFHFRDEGSKAATLFAALAFDSKCDTAVFGVEQLLRSARDFQPHLNWPTVCILGIAKRKAVSPDESSGERIRRKPQRTGRGGVQTSTRNPPAASVVRWVTGE